MLKVKAEAEPKVKRLRDRGTPDLETEARLREVRFDATLALRWKTLEHYEQDTQKAAKERKAAFENLYGVAQAELDYPAPAGDACLDLSEDIFEILQRAVNAHTAMREHRAMLTGLRATAKKAKEQGQGERASSSREPRTGVRAVKAAAGLGRLLCDIRQARATLLLYQENQQTREDRMVAMLETSHLFDVAAPDHDLQEQLVEVRREAQRCETRSDNLRIRYDRELLRYLKDNPGASRTAFDRRFFRDRCQATRELAKAQDHCRGLQWQIRDARLVSLADATSDFGSFSEYGQAQTLGEAAERNWRQRRQLNRLRIEHYRSQRVLAGAPVSPSEAPSIPSKIWSGISIQWGGSDCPSNEAVNSSEKRRIREWKAHTTQLRTEQDYGAPNTGYRGGGFVDEANTDTSRSGICGWCKGWTVGSARRKRSCDACWQEIEVARLARSRCAL